MQSDEQIPFRERVDAQEGAAAIRFESYLLHNAIRNSQRLCEGTQEVFLEPRGTPWLAGWRWHWPGENGEVAAFPQLQYLGLADDQSSVSQFPCALGAIRTCGVTYDVVTFALGTYSLLLEVEVCRKTDGQVGRMIWLYLDSSHGVSLSGTCADHLALDDRWYAVYPDAATFQHSHSVAFVAQIARLHGHLRLPVFWEYLLRQRFLTEQDLITRISFGNEISSGSGETTVYRYAVELTIDNYQL